MKVLAIQKGTLNVTTLSSVTNIAYDSVTDVYTISHGGGTATYSGSAYNIAIIW